MSKTINFPTEEKITEWLEEKGYDGFYNEIGPCGCSIGDLFPCGDAEGVTNGDCHAARKGPGGIDPDGQECEYMMYPIKKDEDNE